MDGFVQMLIQALQAAADPNISVELREATKRNGMKLHAISLVYPGKCTSRNFYVEEYYCQYQNGVGLDSIVREILSDENAQGRCSSGVVETIKNIYDFDSIKGKIIFKLVSLEKNAIYLSGKVYMKYLDFAVCFAVADGDFESGEFYTINLPNPVFNSWGIPMADLFKIAQRNTRDKLPERIFNLQGLFKGIYCQVAGGGPSNFKNLPGLPDALNMYALTNSAHVNGAAVILYENVLKDFAGRLHAGRLFLLPSSIHEFIIIPASSSAEVDTARLSRIVGEVNKGYVKENEVLSDRVYVYDREADEIH